MKKLSAFYFSGTGNTQYIVKKLCEHLKTNFNVTATDVTVATDFARLLREAEYILIAFPIYGSAPPEPIVKFVYKNAEKWTGKKIIVAVTQYMFSGDGAASIGRSLKKLGGNVCFAEHFNMPNNLSDLDFFKIRNGDELKKRIAKADERVKKFADRIKNNATFRRGFNPISHAIGYYCQRKWWRKGENEKKSKLIIDITKCIGCGLCTKNCPVHNLKISEEKAVANNECALCYRCVNNCPKKAVALFGKNPPSTQYKGVKL